MTNKNIQEVEKFECLVREKLQDASLEAPEGVWNAIAGELDSMRDVRMTRRRRLLIWSSVSGLAVAASVALAVVFNPGVRTSVDIIPQAEELAYSDVPVVVIPDQEDVKPQCVTSCPGETSPILKEETVEEETWHPEVAEAGGEETYEVAIDEASPTGSKSGNEVNDELDGNWTDPFLEPEVQGRKSPKVSFNVFGDAAAGISNGKTTVSKMRAPKSKLTSSTVQESSASDFALPLTFGLGTKIYFNDKWALGTGLTYSYLSRTFDGRYTQVSDEGEVTLTEDFTGIRNSQHYLGIPIYGYYDILNVKRLMLYVYAGGVVEKCLSNKFYMNGESGRYVHSVSASGVQLSVAGGFGVEYDFTRFMGLYLDPSVRYYFNMNQPKSVRTQQPLNFGLELGLRFKL